MNPRRRFLSVIIHDVPVPRPKVGEMVEVVLDGVPENAMEGRVHQHLDAYGTLRVELLGDIPTDPP